MILFMKCLNGLVKYCEKQPGSYNDDMHDVIGGLWFPCVILGFMLVSHEVQCGIC